MPAGIGRAILEQSKKFTDAPDLYLELARYWILSSTLGRFTVIPFSPRSDESPLRPNIWVIISGPPGIMRKSTVIDTIARLTVKRAWRKYLQTLNPGAGQDKISELLANMFIETGSYEGIAKHISSTQKEVDTFFIVSAEWGGILRLMKSREYMVGFATLLSKLYSGEEHIARYAKETRHIRGGLYVTALLGMQEPWLYLDNFVFRQGLMRRVIFIYQDPSDKTRWLPPLDLTRVRVAEELARLADMLGDAMLKYRERAPVIAHPSGGAVKAINDYARKLEEEIRREGASNWNLYAQNLWEHLLKLSVLEAVDSQEPRETGLGWTVHVTEEHVWRAMDFLSRANEKTREALSRAGAELRPVELRTVESAEELVAGLVDRLGCARTSELLRRTRIAKSDLKQVIVNLVETGRIYVFMTRNGRRGRPSLYFCSPRAAVDFAARNPGASLLDSRTVESAW